MRVEQPRFLGRDIRNSEPVPESRNNPPVVGSDELVEICGALDRLALESIDLAEVLTKLSKSTQESIDGTERSELVCRIERALAFGLQDDPRYAGAVRLGNRFSSLQQNWPPAYEELGLNDRTLWISIADTVSSPMIKSHMRDLVLSTSERTTPEEAEAVIAEYLEVLKNPANSIFYRVACGRRAWSLSRRFKLQSEMCARWLLFSVAEEKIAEAENVPKHLLPENIDVALLQPFESLVQKPAVGEFVAPSKSDIAQLLVRARKVLHSLVAQQEPILALFERLGLPGEELEQHRRFLIESYISCAEHQQGFTKIIWLETAIRLAKKYQIFDLRDAAIAEIQSFSPDDLEFDVHASEVALSIPMRNAHYVGYRKTRSLFQALQIWWRSSCPTGNAESNLKQAQETMRNSILKLVTRTTFDENYGLPVRTSRGEEGAVEEQRERLETLNAALVGSILADELVGIFETYNAPISKEDLAFSIASTYHCSVDYADVLAEALLAFRDERVSDAGRMAWPLIEAAARALLLSLGAPLYRIQEGKGKGRFPSLDAYIDELEKRGLDPDWVRCLRNPIADIRNSMAHGHKFRLRPSESALLIRTASMLVLLTPPNAAQADKKELSIRLRDPIGWLAEFSEDLETLD